MQIVRASGSRGAEADHVGARRAPRARATTRAARRRRGRRGSQPSAWSSTASASSPSSWRSPGAQASTAVPLTALTPVAEQPRSRARTASLSRCSSAMHSAPVVPAGRRPCAEPDRRSPRPPSRVVEGEGLLDERGQLPRVRIAHGRDDRVPQAASPRTSSSPRPRRAARRPRRSGSRRRAGRAATRRERRRSRRSAAGRRSSGWGRRTP